MKGFLHHLRHYLVPHQSNNHRPKLLHTQTLLALVLLLVAINIGFKTIHENYPEVLGISANISNEDLLKLTNEKRAEKGLKPLKLNTELSQAAGKKADYMFAKNFWAHIGPDGTTPWFFIRNAGYDYIYAGENLARGYTTAPDVVDAWMASPSHRENILSPNYSDIGFYVESGTLTGSDTVLVVEMFGTKAADSKDIASADASGAALPQANTELPQTQQIAEVQGQTAPSQQNPVFNSQIVTQRFAVFLVALLIGVLLLDAIIIERKKIARLVAHNGDHIAFLVMILIAIILLERGIIL
jgi:uncharacterized protein YkwD